MASCFLEKENLLVANKGFTQGEHYWELITPINCNGMQMGVVEEDYNLNELNINKENSKIIL